MFFTRRSVFDWGRLIIFTFDYRCISSTWADRLRNSLVLSPTLQNVENVIGADLPAYIVSRCRPGRPAGNRFCVIVCRM